MSQRFAVAVEDVRRAERGTANASEAQARTAPDLLSGPRQGLAGPAVSARPEVLIAGASARGAVESAVRAGFPVQAIDGYGDADNPPGASVRALPRDYRIPFGAAAAAQVARSSGCPVAAYLSPFENDPDAVATLAQGRTLWGNPPDVVRRVRDPRQLASTLRARGLPVPVVRTADGAEKTGERPAHGWLLKPLASGGGRGIRRWTGDPSPVPRGCYLQAFVPGTPASVVFVAARGRAAVLGLSRQIVGDAAFGASGFRYCGSILCAAADPCLPVEARLRAHVAALVSAVAGAFGLVGVNGMDLIVCGDTAVPIEVNPRWCASMELVERMTAVSVFGMHAAACTEGTVPSDLTAGAPMRHAAGKAIVFARQAVTMGDTRAWIGDPNIRDVPHPGERIEAGRPVCTVFATAPDGRACHAALVDRARWVEAEMRSDRGG